MKGLLKYITILFITFSLFSNETQERVPLGNRKLSEEELKELYSSEENSFNEKRTNFIHTQKKQKSKTDAPIRLL